MASKSTTGHHGPATGNQDGDTPIGRIPLSPDDAISVQNTMTVIAYLRGQATMLHDGLAAQLWRTYGIDIVRESWRIEAGSLVREGVSQPEPQHE